MLRCIRILKFFRHDMDAVFLANFATEFTPYAIRLLKSGRYVMSEVPNCETLAQAVELIEAVEESGKVFTLVENYCYIHDQSAQYAMKTAGDLNHGCNSTCSTFQCTHAINLLLFILYFKLPMRNMHLTLLYEM